MSIEPRDYRIKNEQGIISITVTVVFVMVITLIVLGFSQVTQRNGKLALDRELSVKASTAAEVGINDAMTKIADHIDKRHVFADGKPFPQQDKCEGTTSYRYNKKGPSGVYGRIFDNDPTVRYTCLLVSEPPDLRASNVGTESLVWPLDASGLATEELGQIKIEWDRAPGTTTGTQQISDCTTGGMGINRNIAAGDWAARCQFGVLRIDLIKNDADVVDGATVAAGATMTAYIYPNEGAPSGGSDYAYNDTINNFYGTKVSQGRVGYADCSEDTCSATISGLTFEKAYVRISSLYQNASSVRIERFNLDGSTSTGLENAQVLIDVTGKAQDVLKRVQARVNITGSSSGEASNYFSDYGLQSADSICKRYNTSPRVGAQADVPLGSGC